LGGGFWSDIGIVKDLDNIGFLQSPKLGFVMSGLGKEYNYAVPPMDMITGTNPSSGFPSAFTPSIGFSADLFNSYNMRLHATTDLRFPAFSDIEGELGLSISYRTIVNLNVSFSDSLFDIKNKTNRNLVPSVTLAGNIPLGGKDPMMTGVSSVSPSLGFMPCMIRSIHFP